MTVIRPNIFSVIRHSLSSRKNAHCHGNISMSGLAISVAPSSMKNDNYNCHDTSTHRRCQRHPTVYSGPYYNLFGCHSSSDTKIDVCRQLRATEVFFLRSAVKQNSVFSLVASTGHLCWPSNQTRSNVTHEY